MADFGYYSLRCILWVCSLIPCLWTVMILWNDVLCPLTGYQPIGPILAYLILTLAGFLNGSLSRIRMADRLEKEFGKPNRDEQVQLAISTLLVYWAGLGLVVVLLHFV